jgi:hypothetical protein
MKGMARISSRAPRHLSGLADAKVDQHGHRYGQAAQGRGDGRALGRGDGGEGVAWSGRWW